MTYISDIRPQKKGSLFNIFINGEFAFSADSDLIAEYQLTVGKELSEDENTEVTAEADARRTVRYARFLLEYRDYTHAELVKKLMEKGYREDASERAAATLEELGCINDIRRAEAIIERYASKYGRDIILFELRKRGISRETAEALLEEHYSEEDGLAAAKREVERRLQGKSTDDKRLMSNIFKSLRVKGFSIATIKKAFAEYGNTD